MLELKIVNNGKEKWQSYEAHVDSGTFLFTPEGTINLNGVSMGADELEARHNLKISLLMTITEIHKFTKDL